MVNLHTHTWLCGHAVGTPTDYAAEAVKRGFTLLGISDHVPFPDNRLSRMAYDQFDLYLAEIGKARAAFPQLKILTAAECEYFPEFYSYYQDTLLGERKLDYLIGSVHFYPYGGKLRGIPWGDRQMSSEEVRAYTAAYVEMLESGLFLFGAHPDTFGAGLGGGWDETCEECARRICQTTVKMGMPLEINTSGWVKHDQRPDLHQPYPLEPFWAVAAEEGVKAVVNADAHAPELVDAYLDKGYALAEKLGVEVVYPMGQ